MNKFDSTEIKRSERIPKLISALYEKMPEIEAERALLITESYMNSEKEPMVMRRALAFAHILNNIPVTIRDNELVVGSATKTPKGCQVFPEFSVDWLESELDTTATREADKFYIAEETKNALRRIFPY
ncbi:MAG: glycyl radical protein, partial [Clostridia bacterium]|nr:glycyl radical protein [Clostridia bacterium]